MAQPRRFNPEGAQFSIVMPEKPKVSVETQSTPLGPVDSKTYLVEETDGSVYSVTVTELPSMALFFTGKQGVYERARHELMKKLGGREVSWNESKGLLKYKADGKVGRAHLLVSDNKLYLVNGLTPRAELSDLQSFLASFRKEA